MATEVLTGPASAELEHDEGRSRSCVTGLRAFLGRVAASPVRQAPRPGTMSDMTTSPTAQRTSGSVGTRLSDSLYRELVADLNDRLGDEQQDDQTGTAEPRAATPATGPGGHSGATLQPARLAQPLQPALRTSHFPDPPSRTLRPPAPPCQHPLDREGSHYPRIVKPPQTLDGAGVLAVADLSDARTARLGLDVDHEAERPGPGMTWTKSSIADDKARAEVDRHGA